MVPVQTLRSNLPPFRNKVKIIVAGNQDIAQIEDEILRTHKDHETDYDKIFQFFDTGNIYDTCHEIWNFLKYSLTYNAEVEEQQSVKSPSAILQPGEHIDCKHYALFAGGILDAIKANDNASWDWCYRFVSDKSRKEATHVFVVVFDKGREIMIDPVLTNFDQHKSWLYSIDLKPMSLVKISGVDDTQPAPSIPVTVDKAVAWVSFLFFVNQNLFSIRTLLTRNPDVVYGSLKDYCLKNGFDFNQLVNFIASNNG